MKKYESIPFYEIRIDGGFWQKRQKVNREVTMPSVLKQFTDTGRFAALRCAWRDGMPNKPHIFYDSDVAKWIESVAYALEQGPMPELEMAAEKAIDEIEKHQCADGYINSYFTGVEPSMRWKRRWAHELYCAGHLMEAAVAWYHATGRDRFLKIMCRYADYIEKVFRKEGSAAFTTPGHEEIELALVRLYNAAGEKRYLELSKFFIDHRGSSPLDWEENEWARRYNQSHVPAREQTTAEGHSVRACYYYSGMADIAREYGDAELEAACERLFDNIAEKRMYVTGGIGSSTYGEAFTIDYDLPSEIAYTETCAAIALCFFARRMLLLNPKRKYADVIERALYNGFLSGVSLDGREFFYTNPLEITLAHHFEHPSYKEREWLPDTQRVEVFSCSCCPPNVTRLIASVGDYIYTQGTDTVYMHQYIAHNARIGSGSIHVSTDYPANGSIEITAQGLLGKTLALRIPGWCRDFTLSVPYVMKEGYAFVTISDETKIVLNLDMPAYLVKANAKVADASGKAALMRGPVVYCLEGMDNAFPITGAAVCAPLQAKVLDNCEPGLPMIEATGTVPADTEAAPLYSPLDALPQDVPLRFIPYYAFANRGESDMRVWLPIQRS